MLHNAVDHLGLSRETEGLEEHAQRIHQAAIMEVKVTNKVAQDILSKIKKRKFIRYSSTSPRARE
tara:strand:+ start:473 stop:667 length:195 start_codon:yes stop_codon:yes gene_type:complete